jgi:hypothetical protein
MEMWRGIPSGIHCDGRLMDSALDSAQARCAQWRQGGQARNYIVDEVPCVAFTSAGFALIASESRSRTPFRDFHFPQFSALTRILPLRTLTIRQIAIVFESNKHFRRPWSRAKWEIWISDDLSSLNPLLRGHITLSWRSKSLGSKKELKWTQGQGHPARAVPKYALALTSKLKRLLNSNPRL